jgi:preprotein translocase subunit YajC
VVNEIGAAVSIVLIVFIAMAITFCVLISRWERAQTKRRADKLNNKET